MTYDELRDFIRNRMRMSHIYQPVMLRTLLSQGGRCSTATIAQEILRRDASQIEYYQAITNNMVGQVLRRHKVVLKEGGDYILPGFDKLDANEIQDLIAVCDERLSVYETERGKAVWEHRRRSGRLISGTLRYEVLKRAAYRCELCGVSADDKALEVDHINPRNQGGDNDIENLQALCFSCNAMKRDRDDTDFRSVRASYDVREAGCVFCTLPKTRILAENALALALLDGHPVTELHTLITPKRHVADYFSLTRPEMNSCDALLRQMRKELLDKDPSIAGFNVGINVGVAAGQTVMHAHIHLIPRRWGDVEVPRGGVRGVIPGKAVY